MNRLIATLQMDILLQKRYGIFTAALVVAIFWVVTLQKIPSWWLPSLLPMIIFLDLGIIGFYFLAGMLLFEKGEGTLEALVVTPLRSWEYITSKLTILTGVACLVSLAVVLFSYHQALNILWLMVGTILTSLFTLLVGFIAVAPYDSISRFLLPSQLYFLVLQLPLLYYFKVLVSPIFYLIPTQGSLFLLQATFQSVADWKLIYAIGYQIIWIILLSILAFRSFNRYILNKEGRH